MASSIDITKPEAGSATTQSVRDNFSAAKTEIEALQAADHDAVTLSGAGTYLSLAGQVITVDAITESDISDLGTYLTGNQTITLSGDITGSGTTAITTTIAAGSVDIAMLSATGTPSSSNYLRGDNTWATVAGGGDVSKVGTPVNNQLGIWTGDGTIEGDTGLTWDGSSLTMQPTAPRLDMQAATSQSATLRLAGNNNILGSASFDLLQNSSNIAYVWQNAAANLILRTGAINAVTIDTSGNIAITGTLDGRDIAADGAILDDLGTRLHASATVIDPESGDSLTFLVPSQAITITGVSAHRQDGTSVVFNVKHGTNPSVPANSLWTSDETVTANTTIDQTFAAYNDATVPADSAVKLEITTVTGAVTEFHVTIEYTVD